MQPQTPIPYAPTPPSDRAHLVRQGDDFTLTLPPRVGWKTAIHLAVLGGFAVLSFFAVALPAGVTRVGGVPVIVAPAPLLVRAFVLLIGLGCVLALAGIIRACRTWTVIGLHRGTLVCTTPGLLTARTVQYPLEHFIAATVVVEDGSSTIELRRREGVRSVYLLSNPGEAVYRLADLEFAAGIIREAIRASADGTLTS